MEGEKMLNRDELEKKLKELEERERRLKLKEKEMELKIFYEREKDFIDNFLKEKYATSLPSPTVAVESAECKFWDDRVKREMDEKIYNGIVFQKELDNFDARAYVEMFEEVVDNLKALNDEEREKAYRVRKDTLRVFFWRIKDSAEKRIKEMLDNEELSEVERKSLENRLKAIQEATLEDLQYLFSFISPDSRYRMRGAFYEMEKKALELGFLKKKCLDKREFWFRLNFFEREADIYRYLMIRVLNAEIPFPDEVGYVLYHKLLLMDEEEVKKLHNALFDGEGGPKMDNEEVEKSLRNFLNAVKKDAKQVALFKTIEMDYGRARRAIFLMESGTDNAVYDAIKLMKVNHEEELKGIRDVEEKIKKIEELKWKAREENAELRDIWLRVTR